MWSGWALRYSLLRALRCLSPGFGKAPVTKAEAYRTLFATNRATTVPPKVRLRIVRRA